MSVSQGYWRRRYVLMRAGLSGREVLAVLVALQRVLRGGRPDRCQEQAAGTGGNSFSYATQPAAGREAAQRSGPSGRCRSGVSEPETECKIMKIKIKL